jgi:UPF0755 protein
MNDIRPPRRPTQLTAPRQPPRPVSTGVRTIRSKSVPVDHRIEAPEPELLLEAHKDTIPPTTLPLVEKEAQIPEPKRRSWRKVLLVGFGLVLVLGLVGLAAGYVWYQKALSPLSSESNSSYVPLTIATGSTPSQIGDLLVEKQLIRSKTAFDIYTRLTSTQNKLQAGSYRLSPSESTAAIVTHLVSGRVDEFTLTFFPGATVTDTTDKAENKKVDVTTILKRAGYKDDEISAALKKTYDHPVFASKPASADLEGYIYGETYNFSTSASVEDILTRTFDELYKQIQDNKLEEGYKAQGLSLYEGITLASVIQREVPSAKDQKQVAQVFLKRYNEGMMLGSDITAYYGADKKGVARTVQVDTLYNTRLHTGLPPGPIAAPGLSALLAVAAPSEGEYVYFLSGDDEVTYFARTNEEHEANIKNHCKVKCAIP